MLKLLTNNYYNNNIYIYIEQILIDRTIEQILIKDERRKTKKEG